MPHLQVTPARRLRHCQIIERSWPVPTLRAFPAPPFAVPYSSVLRPSPPQPQEQPPPYRPRSRSYRKMHDCRLFSDIGVALQISDARRVEAGVPQRLTLQMAIAIGLLMTIAPPVAVTMVWATPAFSRAAQLALTVYGALVTLIIAAVAVAVIGWSA